VEAADVNVGAIVVDFDGTVVDQDISEEILAEFAPPEWWEIDLRFQRGEIGSRECLVRQASLLHGDQREMLRFAVEGYAIDPAFPPFVGWAREHGIVVAVASDGLGFYVVPMLEAAGVHRVPVHTNAVSFSADAVARLGFPHAHPVCSTCGTCKMSIVQSYRDRCGRVAFVGEGHTDRYGAMYADLVFAKKHLPAICRADGVAFVEWTTFDDVRAILSSGSRPVAAPRTARCPGWADPRLTGAVSPS